MLSGMPQETAEQQKCRIFYRGRKTQTRVIQHRCCWDAHGHLEVTRLLLEANADKDKAMNDGATPLFIASQEGQLEVAQLLLEANADKEKAVAMIVGATPLFIASQEGHMEVARLLLEANADKDKARNDGFTPLVHRISRRTVGGCTAFAGGQCRKGQGPTDWRHPSACRGLPWTVGGCTAFAAGQSGQGQGRRQWPHPFVHRGSKRALGGCMPFAGPFACLSGGGTVAPCGAWAFFTFGLTVPEERLSILCRGFLSGRVISAHMP